MPKKVLAGILIACITVISLIGLIVAIGASKVLLFFLLATRDERMGKEDIIRYVTENQAAIEQAVEAYIKENPNAKDGEITNNLAIPNCEGIRSISYCKEQNTYGSRYGIIDERIEFYCGGYGIGSATGYAGFIYLIGDPIKIDNETHIADMSRLGHSSTEMDFYPDGDGWLWKQEDGDNTVYIEHIIGQFYYYLEEF